MGTGCVRLRRLLAVLAVSVLVGGAIAVVPADRAMGATAVGGLLLLCVLAILTGLAERSRG